MDKRIPRVKSALLANIESKRATSIKPQEIIFIFFGSPFGKLPLGNFTPLIKVIIANMFTTS